MRALKRMWVNQPSKNQIWHEHHGKNVLVDTSENLHSNAVTVYYTSGNIISQRMTKDSLSKGWRY